MSSLFDSPSEMRLGVRRDDEPRLNTHRKLMSLLYYIQLFLSRQTVLRSSLLNYTGFGNTLRVSRVLYTETLRRCNTRIEHEKLCPRRHLLHLDRLTTMDNCKNSIMLQHIFFIIKEVDYFNINNYFNYKSSFCFRGLINHTEIYTFT